MDINSIIDLVKDKTGVLRFLIETISKSDDFSTGLRKYVSDDSVSDDKKIKALLEVTANQSIQIKKLATLLLIYSQSDSFTIDLAKLAVKLGKGEEALQAMFENKLRGK